MAPRNAPSKGKISGAIRKSGLPYEYQTLLYLILDHMDGDRNSMTVGLAWPTTETLAIEANMVEAHCQALLDNLAFWGFLTVEATPEDNFAAYRFNIQRLGATDPLAALMLRDKLRRLDGLNDQEHWVLEVLGKYAVIGNPQIEVRVSYELVEMEMPWFSRSHWQWAVRRLREKCVVQNVGKQANQSRRWIHLLIDLTALPEIPISTPSAVECDSTATPSAVECDSTATPSAVECDSTATPSAVECDSTATPSAVECDSTATPLPPLRENTLIKTLKVPPTPPPPPARARARAREGAGAGNTETSPFLSRMLQIDPAAAFDLTTFRSAEESTGQTWHEHYADVLLREYWKLSSTHAVNDPAAVLVARWRDKVRYWDFTKAPRVELLETEAEARKREEAERLERERQLREWEDPKARGDFEPPLPTEESDDGVARDTTAAGAQQLWEAALGHLQLLITRPNYETWLKHTTGCSFSAGVFTVETPNAFVSEMLEQRMYSVIQQTLERVVETAVEIRFFPVPVDATAETREVERRN